MTDFSKISIITATYNSSKTILDCINSVYLQTYPNIEHIIVDGKSSDNTLDLIHSVPNRVKLVISELDRGIYDAMNKGISAATGEIIAILNSDDFYADKFVIEKVVSKFNDSNCDCVFGNLDFISPKNNNKIIRHWKSSAFKKGRFYYGWHPPHPAFFVRDTVYKKYGVFDTDFQVSADFELMLRFLEKENVPSYYIDETLVKMRYGGESTGSLKSIIKGNINVIKAFEKNGIRVSRCYSLFRFFNKLKQFIV